MLNDNDTSELADQKRSKKRAIQRKALNSRFVKAKDLSKADKGDMAALFGGTDIFAQLSANTKKEEAKKSASDDEDSVIVKTSMEFKENSNVVTSKVSYQDYFAQKMAARKAADISSPKAEVKEEVKEDEKDEQPPTIKKEKKK